MTSNKKLVTQEARRRAKLSRESFEDLEQQGQIGLIRAVEQWDPAKGPFEPFAKIKIKSELQHYLRDRGWGVVKPPRRWIETVSKVRKSKSSEETELQAAKRFGITEAAWHEMLTARQPVCFFPEGFDVADSDDEYVELNQAVDRLTEPYKTAVVEHFYNKVGIKTLASKKGTTQAQIKEWIAQGLELLREELEAI